MTGHQKYIISDCARVVEDASDQLSFMPSVDTDDDRKMLEYIAKKLRRVHTKLSMLVKDDDAAIIRAKSLPRLLNEGIL